MKISKLILPFTAIFVLGLSIGILIGNAHRPHGPMQEAEIKSRILTNLKRELQLTNEQTASIEPVIISTASKLDRIHREFAEQILNVWKEQNLVIDGELTVEQEKRLEELYQSAQERLLAKSSREPGGPEGTGWRWGGNVFSTQ